MPGLSRQSGWAWLLALLTVSLLSGSLRAQTKGLPQPELITDRQGLPQGFVPGIVQDRQGFIWLATHDGLCRYDGNRFKVFRAMISGPSPIPFSSVAALLLDHEGRIWITSESGELVLFDPRTEVFANISEQLANLAIPHIVPRQYYPDRQNRLWLTFDGQGLVCYNLITRRVRWFRHQADEPHSLGTDRIHCVLQDQQGTIWFGTEDAGLEKFEEKTGHFVHYHPGSQTSLALPERRISNLYQRPSGELLIGTVHYVCQFNPKTGQLHSHRLPDEDAVKWGDHREWGIRFATDSRGVVYCDQRDRLFRFTDHDGLQFLTRFTPQTGYCSSLLIDRSDVLWVGTDGSGVRKYDLQADGFQTARYQIGFQVDVFTQWLHIPATRISYNRLADPYMFRYALDRQGDIWANIGTSTFYHINPVTHQCENIDFPIPFVGMISPLATDEQGRIWVLYYYKARHYLRYYDPGKRQWLLSNYQIDWKPTDGILQMVVDDKAFWLASVNRGLFRFDRRTGQLRQYAHQPNQLTSLSSNTLYCLSADPDDPNRLWIGTFGKGLCAFDKRTGQCRRITEQDGLPNDVIYSAIPDGHGNLWIGTNKGLCRMNRKTFRSQTYTTEDGLLANEFNRFHYLYLPGPVRRSDGTANGQIIMGGVEGITSFYPDQLTDDAFQPKVELTELYVNNHLAQPDSSSFLRAPIQAVDQLHLPYNQNFLTVHFAALQFNRPGKNRYRYRLEGVDKDWVETNQPQAIYTTLAPDRYTLLVNASNTSGHWSPHVRRLGVTISPPFWNTWWAYVLYVLAVAGSLWYAVRLRLSQLQLRQDVLLQQQQVELTRKEADLQQQEARQLRELDQMKSRFFTNVTHDFRTPLTLILSPMNGLVQELTGTRYEKRLESVKRNANQLLGLINQLLDFSRLEAQTLTLHEVRGDVGQFISQTLELFNQEALTKDIALTYQNSVTGEYWFDADKLERILANLIGNALKFTRPGGQITVSLQAINAVELIVSDTGVGIPPEKLPLIFDRFFQWSANAWSVTTVDGIDADRSSDVTSVQTGTGIGLSLVRELVQLQQGQIEVESQPNQGTTFRVKLPYRRADETLPGSATEVQPAKPTYAPIDTYSTSERLHLLLVEDNPELATFIADSLPADYRISRVTNGIEGLELALAELPDLVISDVMMPLMDGYTFCQKLKEDERTNHIPVILVTARVTLDNRLEGLGRGADDYLTKPFHVEELTLRVHNLLERQRRLSERIRKELNHPSTSPSEKNPAPLNPFLEKLYAILEEKLDDTSFGVEELAGRVNMSRVHLFRKLKALTGLSAGDLIRNYRLKRAAQFLHQGFNSSETADLVGFDSPQYFTKCFREMYQMPPREFAQKGRATV